MYKYFTSHHLTPIALFTFLISALAGCGRSDPSNLAEARRHVEDYSVSPVTFRNMNIFFDTETVSATPGEPIPKNLQAIGFNLTLDGQEMSFHEALSYTDTNAIMILHNGAVIYEDYFNGSNQDSRFMSFSMAKSITSILVGIALNEGHIASLDDPVENYLPDLKNTPFEGVMLKEILLQRAGTNYSEQKLFGDPDVNLLAEQSLYTGKKRFTDFQNTLALQNDSPPGTAFNYSTLNASLLGRVVEMATGESLAKYMEEKLWRPAGMQLSGYWMLDGVPGEGHAFAGGGFNASVQDYARVGQMMLQRGNINGTQILPEEYVTESTHYPSTESVMPPAPRGYQYLWWTFLNTKIFEAVGVHGQSISVDPETNTVIVKMSYWPDRGGREREHMELFKAIRANITQD